MPGSQSAERARMPGPYTFLGQQTISEAQSIVRFVAATAPITAIIAIATPAMMAPTVVPTVVMPIVTAAIIAVISVIGWTMPAVAIAKTITAIGHATAP